MNANIGSRLVNALGLFFEELSSEMGGLTVWLLSFKVSSQGISLRQ